MATTFDTVLRARTRARQLPPLLALLPLVVVLCACGSSTSASRPTATPPSVTVSGALVAKQAVAVARKFVRAFQRNDKRAMISLMGADLRLRNRHEYVAQMLGAQNQPSQIKVVRARTFSGRHGRWTRVIVRLEFDHGAVTDRLTVVKTSHGYRITRINRGPPPTS